MGEEVRTPWPGATARPFGGRRKACNHRESARVLLRVAQDPEGVLSETLGDFGVSRNGLGNLRGGIVILVVLPAVTNQHAAVGLALANEVLALH